MLRICINIIPVTRPIESNPNRLTTRIALPVLAVADFGAEDDADCGRAFMTISMFRGHIDCTDWR
jgi:hypothetical protein